MKRDAALDGSTGSFFAFHGSSADNWHGILHLGLKNMSGECLLMTASRCMACMACVARVCGMCGVVIVPVVPVVPVVLVVLVVHVVHVERAGHVFG